MRFILLRLLFAMILPQYTVAHGITNETIGEGRFLIFPQTSPTRHQLIAGIGIPLALPVSVTTGWVIKAQYFLPYTVDNLKPARWPGWNSAVKKRNTEALEEHYEQYVAKKVKIKTEKLPDDEFEDGDDNYWLDDEEFERLRETDQQLPLNELDAKAPEGYNAEQSRWITYKTLEQVGERYGAGGRPCVLRSICEAARAEFSYTGGVFAELLHVIFTPSTTTESLSEHNDNEYYRAEQLGLERAPCGRIFHECERSILELFTKVHDDELI